MSDIQIVRVTWRDAAFNQEAYNNLEELPEEVGVINESYGICLRDDERGVVIAMERCQHDNTYRAVCEIPRPYVLTVEELITKPQRKTRKPKYEHDQLSVLQSRNATTHTGLSVE